MCEKISNEQKLIDLCFSLTLTASAWESIHKSSNEEIAKWVANNLRLCGFPTEPCGMSWGVLKKDNKPDLKI
jgi:hypothetical protein